MSGDFLWQGDARFALVVTSDGYDLRVGLMLDHQSFGWLVYEAKTMRRLEDGWGTAPTMTYAQRQAEVFVEQHRARRNDIAHWRSWPRRERKQAAKTARGKKGDAGSQENS